jgi:nucleotide-binding universal stress UspA family protein
VLKRLLVAVDQREGRISLIEYAAQLAVACDAFVRVLHVTEFVGRGCRAPLESLGEAERVAEQAVFELRMAGVRSDGLTRSALKTPVSSVIVEEARSWECDLTVVGTHRRGIGGRFGGGVRERVIRDSSIPVLVAPAVASRVLPDEIARVGAP